MPQQESKPTTNSSTNPTVKKKDTMAPITKGTLKQSQKKLNTMLKTARVEKKKSV